MIFLRKDILTINLTYFIVFLYLGRFEDNPIFKVVPVLVMSVAAFNYYNLNTKLERTRKFVQKKSFWFYALVLILSVAIVRTNIPVSTAIGTVNNLISFLAFIILSYQVFKYASLKHFNNIRILHAIIVGPFFFFALVNVFCWMLGLQGAENEGTGAAQSVSAAALGIHVNRVKFFFANGINSYSTVIGALLAIQLTYCFILKHKGWLNYLILSIFSLTIILTDSRAAVGYAIVVAIILFFTKRSRRVGFLKWLPLIIVVGPLVLLSLFPILAQSDFFSAVSRSKEDFATGNSRFLIWGFAISEFLIFKPIHILGYGLYGHFGSGASLLWQNFFSSYDNPEIVHPHNTALSVMFDYGYLGLVVLLIYLFKIARKMYNVWFANRPLSIFFFSFFLYFVLISVTESFFGFYYLDSIYLIFMFFFLANNIDLKEIRINKEIIQEDLEPVGVEP